MNKALYTLLIAALSVGITLAFVAGCSEKCACDTANVEQDASADQMIDNDGSDDNNDNASSDVSGNRSSGQNATTSADGQGTGAPEQRLTKYGDAETGGNVYTRGGYTPERPPGKKLVKPEDSLKTLKGGPSNPIKTGSSGQRTD